MEPIKSTVEILAFKVLNRNVDMEWIKWANDMLEVGYDTKYLTILAGETEPFNQFQLKDLTNKVFDELHLNYHNINLVLNNYCCYLIDKALNNQMELLHVLEIFNDLYYELDYVSNLSHFFNLFEAKFDILNTGEQWYIIGADINNIDKIIIDYFHEWKNNCEQQIWDLKSLG